MTVEIVDVVDVEEPYRTSANSEYKCSEPGVVKYDADCQKFWLCKERPEGSHILESLLYRCPDGYRFSSAVLRCDKADNSSCTTGPLALESRNAPAYQLTVSQLDSFFARYS